MEEADIFRNYESDEKVGRFKMFVRTISSLLHIIYKKRLNGMAYILKTNLAIRGNYGDNRKISSLKYIVLHDSGKDGDSDESNAAYYKEHISKARAHYFVDDDSISISVPDDYIVWSVGGVKYEDADQAGGGKWHGICTNANSISIELCDTVKNGKCDFTEETVNNTVRLVKKLMERYRIPPENVIRHFDVTGKICPKPFVDSEKQWKVFKEKITLPEYGKVTKFVFLKKAPSLFAKSTVGVPEGREIKILERTSGKYWCVNVTIGGVVYKGYINRRYVEAIK